MKACDKLKRFTSIFGKGRNHKVFNLGYKDDIILLEICNVLYMKDELEWKKTGLRKIMSVPK